MARVFELLGYYPDLQDPDVYVSDGSAEGPKAFVAAGEALDAVDPDILGGSLVHYQEMSRGGVRAAIEQFERKGVAPAC